MRYDAFISYSHATRDGEVAHAIQRALERLAKPWWRRALRERRAISLAARQVLERSDGNSASACNQPPAAPWVIASASNE